MAECFTCGDLIPKDQKANKRMVHTSTSRQSLVAVFLMGRPYYQRKHFRMQRLCLECAAAYDEKQNKRGFFSKLLAPTR